MAILRSLRCIDCDAIWLVPTLCVMSAFLLFWALRLVLGVTTKNKKLSLQQPTFWKVSGLAFADSKRWK
ncbi:MAG: hypothetical protein CMJ80_05675 [Planctomycetaceae bacterium]|nr:hypothetical protein [Planctomycetaceae bacterium]